MSRLRLTLACQDYDRTRALWDGRVAPEGIDLVYVPLSAEELFWRQLQYMEFDVSEMSLSNYLTERSRENPRFIAIPVFPSRMFRHSFIFINKKAGIKGPQDLKGKRVGIPEYSMTATVWLRGTLQHDYGVAPPDMEWYVGGLDMPGRKERMKIKLPDDVPLHPIPGDKTLSAMLANGEIDALITARAPASFFQNHPDVGRLWPDYKEVEMDYFKRTKLFPIMHTVAIKQEVYDASPWVAQSLYKAFCEAKQLSHEFLTKLSHLRYMLPWLIPDYNQTIAVMGEDYWPYGVEANRVALEAITQYSYEQGLSSHKFALEELFASSTYEEFKV